MPVGYFKVLNSCRNGHVQHLYSIAEVFCNKGIKNPNSCFTEN